MNIYRHEFKMSFRSVIAWSVAIFSLMFTLMAVFSSIVTFIILRFLRPVSKTVAHLKD